MTTGPRGHDVNPPQRAQFLARDMDFIQANQSLGQRDARFNVSGITLLTVILLKFTRV
jgi:hypothetical protein